MVEEYIKKNYLERIKFLDEVNELTEKEQINILKEEKFNLELLNEHKERVKETPEKLNLISSYIELSKLYNENYELLYFIKMYDILKSSIKEIKLMPQEDIYRHVYFKLKNDFEKRHIQELTKYILKDLRK